jgi:hypothetical protein
MPRSSATPTHRRARTVCVVAALVVACTNAVEPPYGLEVPASWSPAVTNQFFPLTPGTVWELEGQTSEGTEITRIEVLAAPRVVNGVSATVVLDRVYLDGDLIEETYDWFAQDASGNVWYLGEDSREIENGRVVSTEGSWEWGVRGALPGVIMWAEPGAHIGEGYRQEFARGEAEDFGKVLAVGESVTVPAGNYTGCVRTEDWNHLEPGPIEHKVYCPGVGLVLELNPRNAADRVQLRSVVTP